MEVWNHIGFDEKRNIVLLRYLQETGIEYNNGEVDISENDPRWDGLYEILKKENKFYTSEIKFNISELLGAEWLTVRSRWYYDYPQPENGYKSITYAEEYFCSDKECGMEKVQKNCFRFKRTPKWGRRNFCMTNWVYDELFVSPKAKKMLENSDLRGFSFLEVKNKSGKEVLNDIFQMRIPYILPEGGSAPSNGIKGARICPVCGKRKWIPNSRGQYAFHRDAFLNAPDFVKSAECYGAAANAVRKILVSQKAYRFLMENKLDSSLVFEPIILV